MHIEYIKLPLMSHHFLFSVGFIVAKIGVYNRTLILSNIISTQSSKTNIDECYIRRMAKQVHNLAILWALKGISDRVET